MMAAEMGHTFEVEAFPRGHIVEGETNHKGTMGIQPSAFHGRKTHTFKWKGQQT